jgi:putative thiamine transport system permease protein
MVLWSFAGAWRWPDAWPTGWALSHWQRQMPSLSGPTWTTLVVGASATTLALILTLLCLENEAQQSRNPRKRNPKKRNLLLKKIGPNVNTSTSSKPNGLTRSLTLLYVPLIVPQVAFLFGLQVLLVRLGGDGHLWAVVWAHMVFVLPYLLLSLADPWRKYDDRYTRSALSLGASQWRVFWRIKVPILLLPTALAAAVGFAVSVGLYLPTLLAGAGRVSSLTTEAVTLSAGADRRVIGVWAVLQASLPLLGYALALALPRLLQPHRRASS